MEKPETKIYMTKKKWRRNLGVTNQPIPISLGPWLYQNPDTPFLPSHQDSNMKIEVCMHHNTHSTSLLYT